MLDRTVFYAASGGQPGRSRHAADEAGTRHPDRQRRLHRSRQDRDRALCPQPGSPLQFEVGDTVAAAIDWDMRYARMRMHTALHLLSAVLPYPVTGGSVGDDEGRLDFDIPEAGLDKDAITRSSPR